MTESITPNTITPLSPAVLAGIKPTPVNPADGKRSRRETTQNRVAEISSLLSALEAAASESGLSDRRSDASTAAKVRQENLLSEGRLGMANSLLKALRHKHPHSAAHCLRVALGCSAWAEHIGLEEEQRDVLELTALMHDIGKLGASDSVLHNPNRLTSEEEAAIGHYREMGLDILASCCGDERVLEAVRYVGVRHDGQGSDLAQRGAAMPLAARMVSIADAFDAMTTDQVYRPAKARERAISELFELGGTQFDPVLVKQYVDTLSQNQPNLSQRVTDRWLGKVAEQALPWRAPRALPVAAMATVNPAAQPQPRSWFEEKLIDAMHDGVVFVDAQARITLWSKGAERLTGVSSEAAVGRAFAPSLL